MGSEMRYILHRPARHIAVPLVVGAVLFAGVFGFAWHRGYFAGSEVKDLPGLMILKHLRAAEMAYRKAHYRYATLDTLRAAGASLVGEGQTEPSSGYRFTSEVGHGWYTIRAIPPKPGMPSFVLETGCISRDTR